MLDYNELYDLTKELKVLYVEDDIDFQKETVELLKYFFESVDIANNGEDAIEKYTCFYEKNEKYYDIVLTDINMPKLDGVELSKYIYLQNIDQSIVVISAHNESHYLINLINIGVEHFLMKPIDYNKIFEVIHNTVKKKVSYAVKSIDNKIIQLNKNLFWNTEKNSLFNQQGNIKLTQKEILLMELFVNNKTKVTNNETILNTLWDEPYLTPANSLILLISRFRKKIPTQRIENIYGMGYRLVF
ncbi:response regulator transcription factor [Sulfurimonas sp.]|uniref:response regulator transcription factor n=1 Tax=Sulfurimonas sp. TaxID=2022749 RepID=UPI0039E53467